MMNFHFVVPGNLERLTGGSIYNKKIMQGLSQHGIKVVVWQLQGSFPEVDQIALEQARQVVDNVNEHSVLVIDGLALPAFAPVLEKHQRLRTIAIIHLPLAKEVGLNRQQQQTFFALEQKLLRFTKKIVVTSELAAKDLVPYGVTPDKIAVITPGVEKVCENFLRSSPKTSHVQLLCVANVIPRKGHDVLIEALADLKELSWSLQCVGNLHDHPAAVAQIRYLIEKHGLQSRIDLLGEKTPEELTVHYRNADVFVLASFYETYGMVLSEALSYGLPIVTTTGGAIPYTVPKAAGMFVPPQNVLLLKDALQKIISDHDFRQEITQAAYHQGRNIKSWEQSSIEFLHVLQNYQ